MKKLILALCAACTISTAASASQIASPGAAVEKTADKAAAAADKAVEKSADGVAKAADSVSATASDVSAKAGKAADAAAAKASGTVAAGAGGTEGAAKVRTVEESEADLTRQRLAGRLDDLQQYVAPKNVMNRQVAKVKGVFVDEYGGVKPDRVLMAAGVVVVIVGLGFLRRRRRA